MTQEENQAAIAARSYGPWDQFSPREQDIISGLLRAQSVKDIALELRLTVNTVKDYIKTIYQKAQVHSARALLIKFYLDRPVVRAERSRDLADAIQRLLESRTRAVLLDSLLAAARTCTLARQAALFDLAENPAANGGSARWQLRTRVGRDQFPLPAEWCDALEAAGYFQLPVTTGAGLPPPLRWDYVGGGGEMIGVRLEVAPTPKIMLLSEPLGSHFDAAALPTARILACVAEREWQATPASLQ